MSPKPAAATLREIRHGDAFDEILLVDTDGQVVILLAYGLTADEKIRTRESAMRLLSGLVETERMPELATIRTPKPAVDARALAATLNAKRLR